MQSSSSQRTRKPSSELSQHRSTVGVRNRRERLKGNPVAEKLDRAKRADHQALSAARKTLRASRKFEDADSATQTQLLKNAEGAVIEQR